MAICIGATAGLNGQPKVKAIGIKMTETPIKDMSFEQALAELEGIVTQLERGDAQLEESITIYQRGAALKAHCEGKLKDAQLKVEKIVLGSSGEARTAPFDEG